MESTTIAVDLAKSVFQLAVSDRPGHVAEQHRLSRTRFERFFAHRQPATVLSVRRGAEPITWLAFGAVVSDWLPARLFHLGQK